MKQNSDKKKRILVIKQDINKYNFNKLNIIKLFL